MAVTQQQIDDAFVAAGAAFDANAVLAGKPTLADLAGQIANLTAVNSALAQKLATMSTLAQASVVAAQKVVVAGQ